MANSLPIDMARMKFEPLPMEAAIEYWRKLLPLTDAVFKALAAADREMAVAVSGLAIQEEIDTAVAAIDKALADGTTFETFMGDMGPIMEARGWTAYRLDNIFRTNIQTAYNVGRYKEMREAAIIRPYWQYSAVNDSAPGPRTWPCTAKSSHTITPSGTPGTRPTATAAGAAW